MYAEKQCKPTSKTKPTLRKKQILLHSKTAIMSMCYNLKHIIKLVQFFSQTPVGMGPISLKKLYQTTITWYARVEQIKRRSFVACDYDSSHLENLYPNYKTCHKDGNQILKLSLNIMTCTPDQGILMLKNLFLTTTHANLAHVNHTKVQ